MVSKLALAVIAASLGLAAPAAAQVYVDGYYRQDGTYVAPHYRSAPDGNPFNNYSTQGNTNPYTGQPGYVNPFDQMHPAPALGSSYGPSSNPGRYGSSYGH